MSNQRRLVLSTYRKLLQMGQEYPLGYQYFRIKCNEAFVRNKNETDPVKKTNLLKKGEYVLGELEALYKLKKYRTLKKRYYN